MDSELRRRISENKVLTHSERAKIINDLETLEQLRSKIDKAIEEIETEYKNNRNYDDRFIYSKCLDIIRVNIGE